MTIPAGQSGVTYHTGNGTASTFDYEFKITAEADLKVTQTDTYNIDTLLVLGTDYTVSGVGNNAGGAITLVAGPLASGYTLTIEDNVEVSQLTPFGNQSAFYANLHEDSYDKNTRIARKAIYELDRTIKISGSVQGVDTELPKPESLKLFRWNETATALENIETSDLITVAQFSNFRTDTFNDGVDFTSGSTTEINLSSSPGVKANTQIYFDGVYQEKSEYSLNGNLITFNSAIPSGISVIEVTHGKAADVLALDLVSEILSSPYTTTVSDNGKYFEVIGNQTITLVDALSAGAGYRIAVKSDSSSTVTVVRSGSDTIDDATSVQIGPESFAFFIVNSLRNGYISDISKTFQVINVDNINENTLSSGVTIDGVLLKDGGGTLTGNLDVGQTLTVDTVNETTLDTGVTVDGVLLKDGGAVFADGATLEVDTVNEATAAAGVTVDGVLLKDGGAVLADGATLEVDTINEATAAAGVTADGVLLKDGGVTATAASSITASSGTALTVTNTGAGDSLLIEDSSNPDSSPFVVDSTGSVGIGTTSPSISSYAGAGELVIVGTTAYGPQSAWRNTASDATAGYFHFEKSRSGGLVSASDTVGVISWRAHDSADYQPVAMISAQVGATPAAGDTPGILKFLTTAELSTNATERMRIQSTGDINILNNVKIGGSAGDTPGLNLHVAESSADSTSDLLLLANDATATTGDAQGVALHFDPNGNGTLRSASIKSVQSTLGNHADLRFFTAPADVPTERMRIQSDGEINILNNVKIGGSGGETPSARLHVSDSVGDVVRIDSTLGNGGTLGPTINLVRDDGGNGATNDAGGRVLFTNIDDGGTQQVFAQIYQLTTDAAAAGFDGGIIFQTSQATSLATRMRIDAGIQVGIPTGGDLGAGTINVQNGIYVNGVKLNGDVINVRDYGAVGDDSTDDSTAFQNAINAAVAAQTRLHIPEGAYYFASRLTFANTVDVTSDKTASMRWDGIAANVGILLDFEAAGDTLADMEFPMLFGPVYTAGAAGGLPGYSTGTQNPANRIGTAIECRGGNRINVYAHIMNGFENGYYVKSTASSSCDNYNLEVNTSDFCEKWLHLDSDSGRGIATMTARANTVWAKFPIYFSTTSNYVNGANIEITGVTYVNEDGGCGIYSEGTNLRSSTIRINQLQAGTRGDSRTDTSVLLTPSGTMSSTPVQGETITQATSGATGIVVTNADYTLGTTIPFTVKTVSGTFNTTNQLTGSTSGSLGAGSVPASVRGMVCPWIGGNQTMNGLAYDAEQSGTVGYFGGTHCDIQIGAPADFPGGVTDGAMSIFPQPGESVRIRDMGKHNNIKVLFADVEGDSSSATAYTLSSTPGEANFAGGVGSAPFSDYVYCYISADSLASGAVLQRYLYHSKVTDSTTMQPCQVIFKNEGSNNRNLDISAVAFSNGLTNNREIIVKIKNISSTSLETTQNVYFWVKVGP